MVVLYLFFIVPHHRFRRILFLTICAVCYLIYFLLLSRRSLVQFDLLLIVRNDLGFEFCDSGYELFDS